MITVTLDRIRLYARHGVMAQERKVGNLFEVSVTLSYEGKIPVSDSLDDTINYAAVASAVREEMAEPSQLLEHVAFRIARRVQALDGSKVCSGSVTVAKVTPPLGMAIAAASATYSW